MNNQEIVFASYGNRVYSRVIDTIIVNVVVYQLGLGSSYNITYPIIPTGFYAFFIFFGFYYPILEATGGTIGKRIIGIKPLGILSEKKPNIFQSYIRSFLCLVASLIPIVNYFSYTLPSAFRNNLNQTWWDIGSKIVVIKKTKKDNDEIQIVYQDESALTDNSEIVSLESENLSSIENQIKEPISEENIDKIIWLINNLKSILKGHSHQMELQNLLSNMIFSKEDAINLLNEYNKRNKSDLINDIAQNTKTYSKNTALLEKFIEYEIVESKYPHDRKT